MYLLAKEFHGANSYVKERFNVASDIRFDYFLSEEKETNNFGNKFYRARENETRVRGSNAKTN